MQQHGKKEINIKGEILGTKRLVDVVDVNVDPDIGKKKSKSARGKGLSHEEKVSVLQPSEKAQVVYQHTAKETKVEQQVVATNTNSGSAIVTSAPVTNASLAGTWKLFMKGTKKEIGSLKVRSDISFCEIALKKSNDIDSREMKLKKSTLRNQIVEFKGECYHWGICDNDEGYRVLISISVTNANEIDGNVDVTNKSNCDYGPPDFFGGDIEFTGQRVK